MGDMPCGAGTRSVSNFMVEAGIEFFFFKNVLSLATSPVACTGESKKNVHILRSCIEE